MWFLGTAGRIDVAVGQMLLKIVAGNQSTRRAFLAESIVRLLAASVVAIKARKFISSTDVFPQTELYDERVDMTGKVVP